jgi:PASTA domain
MPAFDVLTNPTTLPPLKPGEKKTIVVTATSRLSRAVTGRAVPFVDPRSFTAMVKPPAKQEQNFSQAGVTQEFPFSVEIPADAKPGTFTVRIDVVDVEHQDDNFGQSPVLKVVIAPPPPPPVPPPNGGKPWWFWVLIGVGVVVVGVVLWILLKPKGGGIPDVTKMTFDSAQSKLAAVNVQAFRVNILDRDTTAWKGNIVMRQRPKAGTKLKKDSTVVDTLEVQIPFTVVPILARQQPDVAANKLGLAGLTSSGMSRCTNTLTLQGLVMFLSPSEGSLVARNSAVTVYVGAYQPVPCPRIPRDRMIELQRVRVRAEVLAPVPR